MNGEQMLQDFLLTPLQAGVHPCNGSRFRECPLRAVALNVPGHRVMALGLVRSLSKDYGEGRPTLQTKGVC